MVYEEYPELGPGPTRLKSVVQILLERIAGHLEEEAQQFGGALNEEQLRRAIEAFRARTDDDTLDFYRAGWNECLAVIDEVRRESSQRMPFERLVVRPFAHLFPGQNQPVIQGCNLSRRILPGFVSAIQQMLGPVLLEQYQTRCRELVRIIQVARGNDFDWNDVHTDPTSQVIVNDVLVHVSKHFANLPRRRDWMIDLIVANMPLGEDETERSWTFGEAEFHLLMEALFRPLRYQLATPDGAQRMRDRYGTVACELLAELFAELGRPGTVTPLRRIAP